MVFGDEERRISTFHSFDSGGLTSTGVLPFGAGSKTQVPPSSDTRSRLEERPTPVRHALRENRHHCPLSSRLTSSVTVSRTTDTPLRLGVADHVGQSLLRDPVDGHLHGGRQRRQLLWRLHQHLQALSTCNAVPCGEQPRSSSAGGRRSYKTVLCRRWQLAARRVEMLTN